jgi:hypothetical protein
VSNTAVPTEPAIAAAVTVIPFVAKNVPPAVMPVVAAFLMLKTVGDVSTVTVKLFDQTSSAAVGNAPVFHTVVSLQLPLLTA